MQTELVKPRGILGRVFFSF